MGNEIIDVRVNDVIMEHTQCKIYGIQPEKKFEGKEGDLTFGMDELDKLEFIMSIEDEFGIEIPDDDAEKITTVQEMYDYVSGKVCKEV